MIWRVLAWQVSILFWLTGGGGFQRALPIPPRWHDALHIRLQILFHAWPPRHDPPKIPFPFLCVLLFVIKVASLMMLESGDKTGIDGAFTNEQPGLT